MPESFLSFNPFARFPRTIQRMSACVSAAVYLILTDDVSLLTGGLQLAPERER